MMSQLIAAQNGSEPAFYRLLELLAATWPISVASASSSWYKSGKKRGYWPSIILAVDSAAEIVVLHEVVF